MVARPRTRLAPAALALSLLAGCGAGAEGTRGDDSVASAAATDTATTTVSAPSSSPPSETTSETPSETTSTTAAEDEIRDLRRAIDKVLEDAPLTFATRSAELGKEAKKALREVAEAAARHESSALIVTTTAGYRDDDKAKKLSKQRAEAIADELIANDVAEDRIEIKALGNRGVHDGSGDSGDSDDAGTGVYAKITVAED